MLSNAYFLAKIRFDTTENEPAKNLQKFANFAILEGARGRGGGFREAETCVKPSMPFDNSW